MRDENYYREKQNKPLPTVQKIHESHVKKERAIGMLREFFRYAYIPIMKRLRPSDPDDKLEFSLKKHKRSTKERRMRRIRHQSMMRNHA